MTGRLNSGIPGRLRRNPQGKPDVALGIARQWFDRDGVDVAMDFQNSAIALAIAGLAREKDKVAMPCNSGTTALTGAQCSPNTVHWAYDTYMLAKTVGGATVKAGGDRSEEHTSELQSR